MADPVQFTRGTLSAWLASTKVLLDGQLGYVRHADGTFEPKMGNGADEWEDLPGQKLPTGAVARYTTIDVVADHGADRTGSSSSVAAFNAAIAAANAAGGSLFIWVPPGLYDLTAGLSTAILASHVYIRGAGTGVTRLKGQTGTLFTFGNGSTSVSGGGVFDLTLWYATADSGSRAFYVKGSASSQRFENLFLDGVRQLAQLGDTGGSGFCTSPKFSYISGATDPAAGSIVIDVVQGAALFLENVVVYANGVGFPTGSDPHPAADTTFLRIGQASWDTIHCRSVLTNRYSRGLLIDAAASTACSNMWFTDCVFDYCKTNGVKIATATGSNVRSVFFNSGWAVASDGYGVEISGSAGFVKHIHFTDFVSRQCGKCSWRFTSTVMDDVVLTSCMGMGANRLTRNTGTDQDDLVILATGVTVRGGYFGEDGSSYGVTGQGRYGVSVAPDLDAYQIQGVDAAGSTGGFSIPATNTAASTRRLVRGNRKLSRTYIPEYAGTSSPAPPTSGVTQTHTGATFDTVYIYGGTVTNVTHRGVQVADSSGVTLNLVPGDKWAVTYRVAPTIRRMVSV